MMENSIFVKIQICGMCRAGDHYYNMTSSEEEKPPIYLGAEDKAHLYSDGSSARFQVSGNQYRVGPYKISSSMEMGEISVSGQYVVRTPTGTQTYNISSVSKEMNGSRNCNIYFNVPNNTIKIINVNVNVNFIGGKIVNVKRKIAETYECFQISPPGTHSTPSGTHANMQRMKKFEEIYDKLIDDVTLSTSFENKYNKGNLWIEKIDIDSRARVNGAKVTISGPGYYQTNAVVNNGYIVLRDMPIGKYTITETGAPDGYVLDLQTSPCVTSGTANVPNGGTSGLTLTNRMFGDLKIRKVDQDTGHSLGSGVQFKIYTSKGYIRQYVYGKPSQLTFTTNEALAQIFTTDKNGEILLLNIPVNETYYIKEYALPINLQHYYEVKKNVDSVVLKSNVYGQSDKAIANKQLYVDVSGYVWEDIGSQKMTSRNDLYKDNNFDIDDKLLEGIPVKLRKSDGTLIAETKTDKNGAYKFYGKEVDKNKIQIEIGKLPNYYIEFEYNGLMYQNVIPHTNKNNGSKSKEKDNDRNSFNDSFAIISGGNSKEESTHGYSRNTANQITNDLIYKNGNYSSSIFSDMGYFVDNINNIIPNDGSIGTFMKADTDAAIYKILWSPGVYEIKNINLGIFKREQPDMAIATDVDKVDLSINGYSHTYSYGERYKLNDLDIFSEITKYDEESDLYKNKSYVREYSRGIYSNYAYANSTTGKGKLDDNDKLKFYTTYKITVKNESSSLKMTANEIVSYCDMTFDVNLLKSWYVDSNGNKVDVIWNYIKDTNGYQEIRTTSLKNEKIDKGQSIIIYMNIPKKASQVIEWGKISDLKNFEEKTHNVTEIASYSTFDSNGNRYAGIDTDSAPDNIVPGLGKEFVKRYEDDTDVAPVLTIKLNAPRTISGYVYEDYTDSKLNTKNERKGDGKYNASKDGYVENVKVELINNETGDSAYIYPEAVSDNNFDAKKAEYLTKKDEKGYYEFVGVIPGKYYLKFTYDDNSVIYKTVDGKIVSEEVNTQNYKSTIITSADMKVALENEDKEENQRWYQNVKVKGYSSAVDDYEKRLDLNEKLSKINYENVTNYEDKNGEYASYHTMAAKSPLMDVAIENKNGETTIGEEKRVQLYDNLDFGIVERPRQSIEVNKEISKMCLTLANGQILAQGDPRNETINYVTYPEGGTLKIEIDKEIIEGATLDIEYEITVKNNSELDYDAKKYYIYGDSSGLSPVKIKLDSIADYVDEKLSVTYNIDNPNSEFTYYNSSQDKTTDKWMLIVDPSKENNSLTTVPIDSEVWGNIKNRSNIVVKNTNIEMSPLDKEPTRLYLSAKKLLSDLENTDNVFNNYTELIQVSNSVGRFYGQMSKNEWQLKTPGNFNIKDKLTIASTNECDNSNYNRGNNIHNAQLIIIPPTGVRTIMVYCIIGVVCLVLLAGGIILIKKNVLG